MIAQVGVSIPENNFDTQRRLEACVLLGKQFLYEREDQINLEAGRDFLRERRCYDAVVLHSIFHNDGMFECGRKRQSQAWRTLRFAGVRISQQHNLKNWRQRLIRTKAKMIIVFELLPSALSGWKLGEISGYRMVYRDHRVTIYRRKRT